MKRLWRIIDREMHRDALTAKQMATRLGMDPAHLSRLRTGQLRDLSGVLMARLVAGFAPELHPEILSAYLADKLEGTGISAHAQDQSAVLREEAPAYEMPPAPTVAEACARVGVNRRVAGALGILAEHAPGNRRLQALIVSLASFVRKK